MTSDDWASIAENIGLELLGEPKSKNNSEIRWGTHGSWVLNRGKGVFYSFELDQGFGVHDLLKHFEQDVKATLQRFGFSDEASPLKPQKSINKVASSLSRNEMAELWLAAEYKVKYSDNFMVLRFPEGHYMSHQKYAPYTKVDDSWVCRRPDGKLPLYITPGRGESLPVLVVEGEKAAIATEKLYNGQVCCHHGGAKGWEKTDWKQLYGRDVYIYPDNDEPGFAFASELSRHLRANGSMVLVCKPHPGLQEKEDLHEALEKNLYLHSDDLVDYIKKNPMPKPKGAFYATPVGEVCMQADEPKWLIQGVMEEGSLMAIFGAPKSGKSFVALAMAASVATGQEYFGLKANKGSVLYVCGEGLRGQRRRSTILRDQFEGLFESPLYLTNRTIKVNDDKEFELLVDEIKMIELHQGQLNMIVLDTFQRTFIGNENSAEEVGYFISKCDQLISDFGCTVVLVHHSGHAGGKSRARGSSVIPASLDYEFRVERKEDDEEMIINLEQTLNKDGMGSVHHTYKLVDHSVKINDKMIQSAYLEKIDYNPKEYELHYHAAQLLAAFEADHAIEHNNGTPNGEIFFTQGHFKDRVTVKEKRGKCLPNN